MTWPISFSRSFACHRKIDPQRQFITSHTDGATNILIDLLSFGVPKLQIFFRILFSVKSFEFFRTVCLFSALALPSIGRFLFFVTGKMQMETFFSSDPI